MLEKLNGRRLAASLASSSSAHDQQHKFGAGKLGMFDLLQLRHSQDRWGRSPKDCARTRRLVPPKWQRKAGEKPGF